jgi:hypothetical protein
MGLDLQVCLTCFLVRLVCLIDSSTFLFISGPNRGRPGTKPKHVVSPQPTYLISFKMYAHIAKGWMALRLFIIGLLVSGLCLSVHFTGDKPLRARLGARS